MFEIETPLNKDQFVWFGTNSSTNLDLYLVGKDQEVIVAGIMLQEMGIAIEEITSSAVS